jgi:Spy/CpxP family protein refolding chaperone
VKRWQALAALAGLFVLGVVSGALGAHLYYARALERPPGPPPFFAPLMGPRLERMLDLTPVQRDEVRIILEESRRDAEALRGDLAPRLRELMERSHRRIDELLTPEQRRRFDELRRSHRRREERFLGGRGGRRHQHRPGPPPHG